MFYVHRGFTLYFLSDPDSRHCRELAASPQVAATITEDYGDWRRIKGIQLEGVVEPVSSRREQVVALAAYVAKFPFVAGFFPATGMQLSRMRIGGRPVSVRLYKVVPQRLLYLDNEKGFHHREELVLAERNEVATLTPTLSRQERPIHRPPGGRELEGGGDSGGLSRRSEGRLA